MLDETANWTRPQSVAFPKVWRRFKGLREINGTVPSFWIQDIPENERENVVNFMTDGFCKEETLCKSLGLLNDPESVETLRKAWRLVLLDNVGLACYMENLDPNGKPILAAANCTHIKKCDEEEVNITITGSKVQQIFATLNVLMDEKNAFEFLETDFLLSALGLYVLPQFRGQGLGLELLNSREDICRALAIKASITVFTSSVSQYLAEKAGFKLLSEISFEDLRNIHKYEYPGIEEKQKGLKYMYNIYL
ncbi:uncharacterized protein LOC116172411 isoform X2 [Photinus pyralis]|uniref:N-acetyltransferase domain-containing protein n=2 Tax=Photinus pyralis TaxID=7054 RepID=A0A1Y1L937_PHOPY|nr:uncharacterized protein LOC116172411 isoform X2 [Photinus pyralis]